MILNVLGRKDYLVKIWTEIPDPLGGCLEKIQGKQTCNIWSYIIRFDRSVLFIGPMVIGQDYQLIDASIKNQGPSSAHWFWYR